MGLNMWEEGYSSGSRKFFDMPSDGKVGHVVDGVYMPGSSKVLSFQDTLDRLEDSVKYNEMIEEEETTDEDEEETTEGEDEETLEPACDLESILMKRSIEESDDESDDDRSVRQRVE